MPDVLKVQSLFVVPSSRNSSLFVTNSQQQNQAGMQRLAPIEMAAQSIHMASSTSSFIANNNNMNSSNHGSPLVASRRASSAVRDMEACHSQNCQVDGASSGCCQDFCMTPASVAPPHLAGSTTLASKPWSIPVRAVVPLTYSCCGAGLCLCHLMAPGYVHACTLLLSPLWTLALALHAVAMRDLVWLWLGLLALLLLPFTLLVADMIFVAFYLAVFAVFASGRFWHNLKGLPFLMVSLCWFGLASSLALSAVLQEQPVAQLAIATFFALAAGVVSASQLSRIIVSFP